MLNKSNHSSVIYFDNAATSWPKPKSVSIAMLDFMENVGANPGRSGHCLAVQSGQILFGTRRKLANLFGLRNPMHVIFTSNATEALNIAISGVIEAGDHVITSSMEHNSTIRPLHYLRKTGKISLTILAGDKFGTINAEELEQAITTKTKALVINHVSNVNSSIQPLSELGKICREKHILFIVDASQSAGVLSIDMPEMKIDLMGFPGHKSLYGATGTGALLIADDFDIKRIKPLKFGGTGSFSDSIEQPDFLPDMLESGTLNIAGIAGWKSGMDEVFEDKNRILFIQNHKQILQDYFLDQMKERVPEFIHFNNREQAAVGVIAFRIKSKSVSEVAQKLSENYNIMCRHGLHCAPLAHQKLQTFPEGTLRFGFGIYNTTIEIDFAVKALEEIASEE